MDRFRLMETYVAVAKRGSYTQAAKDLGLTRAMVSKRVSDLESALGIRLLNRNAHRVSTTAAGLDYLASCVSLLDQVSRIEDQLVDKHAAPQGELKILASKTLGDLVLAPIVGEFCAEYPKINVRLLLRDMAPHGMDLISEGFDIALRTLPVSNSSLIAKPIVRLRRALVASPAYLARAGKPGAPEDLANHNCLHPNDSLRATWKFTTKAGKLSIAVSGRPQANSSAVVRHAALSGLGIALLSEFIIAEDLARGALVKVLPEAMTDHRMLYCVYQKDQHQPFRVKAFLDHVTRRMKTFRWADKGGERSQS